MFELRGKRLKTENNFSAYTAQNKSIFLLSCENLCDSGKFCLPCYGYGTEKTRYMVDD